VAGEDDDRDVEPALAEVVDQAEAVHPGHLDIEEKGVRDHPVEKIEALEGVRRLLHLVPGSGENVAQHLAHPGLVVDDENPPFHGRHGSSLPPPAAASLGAFGSGLRDPAGRVGPRLAPRRPAAVSTPVLSLTETPV